MTATNLRPELADHLRQRLAAFGEGFRQNLALIGPSGSGKTFQLHQLMSHPPAPALFIYCPLYREACRAFIHRLLCATLQAGLPPAARSGSAPPATPSSGARGSQQDQPLEALLRAAEPTLPKTAAAIRALDGLLARRLYGEALSRALDTIPILREERGRPCVLILDEFLYLEELGLAHAFHELGKRVMTWNHTLFFLASSSPYRARRILRERLQLLFGQFELLELDSPNASSASAWVQQELKGIRGVRASSAFLIRWLGSYPWYLTVLLRRLRELAALRKSPDLSEALFLQAAWDVVGTPEGALHRWCASRLEGLAHGRLGPRAVEALIQVAQGARTTTEIGQRIGRAGLSEALQCLVEQDLAQRNGMCWTVTDPVLRCWLATVFHAQRAEVGLDEGETRQRLEQYLRSLWATWMQATQLSCTQQVVELFGRFRDETVSLNAKTGRLPTFQTIRTHHPDLPGVEAYLIAEGQGRRWCASVQPAAVDETAIAHFEAFCRSQYPKPARKVVITTSRMDQHARLVAKAANMWVWEADDLQTLRELYGQV